MDFDEFDARMRVFETAYDHYVLPGIFIVARLDGRNFTRLTKEIHPFETPFDERFRDHMIATVMHLMNSGFRVIYGYTQSDEISLLFHLLDNAYNRKERKLNSILAGEASATFSLRLGQAISFDCRISQLPHLEFVQDYFLWRAEDAHRNALNAHCYWSLRKNGKTNREAARLLAGMSVADKNELLFRQGINYNDLPAWQKRGVGLVWETYQKTGRDPRTNQKVVTNRRRIQVKLDLPIKEAYSQFIQDVIRSSEE